MLSGICFRVVAINQFISYCMLRSTLISSFPPFEVSGVFCDDERRGSRWSMGGRYSPDRERARRSFWRVFNVTRSEFAYNFPMTKCRPINMRLFREASQHNIAAIVPAHVSDPVSNAYRINMSITRLSLAPSGRLFLEEDEERGCDNHIDCGGKSEAEREKPAKM